MKFKKSCISGNLLEISSDFANDRKQRVLLNGQTFTLKNVNAGVLQGSILGPSLFLICINDLSGDLFSKTKLFAHNISILTVADDINTLVKELNSDLKKVSNWEIQWKMSFNPDASKHAQKAILVIFATPSFGL